MATSSLPTYDPKTTATNLATNMFADRKDLLTNQSALADATASELTKLGSALSAFQSSLDSLSGKKSVLANTGTFSSDVGTVTANASATPGTYSFYVDRLATAGQVSYAGISDTTTAASSGNLMVTLADGTNFGVTLSNADKNLDGKLSAKEIAAAINVAAGNDSRVTASTLTVNGQTSLVLTSAKTGAANDVSLDVSGVTDPALATALGAGNQKRLTAAQDAVVYFGGDQTTGIKIQQASNTFTAIDGVTMTFNKTTTAPVSLTVAKDSAGTAANVQSFVDAWNKLQTVLKTQTQNGNAADGDAVVQPGIFASDTGLNALRSRMTTILRQVSGTQSLATYGVTLQRDGTLSLDSNRLDRALTANPSGLDDVFGSTATGAQTGVMGAMDKLLSQWTNSATGQISVRRDSNSKLQVSLAARKTKFDADYELTYNRYFAQFSQLQTLQAQMSQTGSLFDSLFAKDS
jgi:flagellar hook-associated protein 2